MATTSFVWDGASIGGEPHRPYVQDKKARITWPEVCRKFFTKEQDYARLRRFGFPEGSQGFGTGNGAPRPPMEFKTREIEAWMQNFHALASEIKK
jgi:hypothetical protein